jgi:hypothetical protein
MIQTQLRAQVANPGVNGVAVFFDSLSEPSLTVEPYDASRPLIGDLQRGILIGRTDQAIVFRHEWQPRGGIASVYHAVNDSGELLAALDVDVDKIKFVKIRPATTTSTCRVITAAALPACTASGTKAGKTLTANAVGILTVDGVNCILNDIIGVKDEVNPVNNGIYTLTTAGTAGVAFILTRNTSYDVNAELLRGHIMTATAGTTNITTYWQIPTTPRGEAIAASTLLVRDTLLLPGRNRIVVECDVLPTDWVFEFAIGPDRAIGLYQ